MAKKNSLVEEIQQKYHDYRASRDPWAVLAQEDIEFRLGIQWTEAQAEELSERGQAPVVINRIHPAVETLKAMLTANRPSFRTSPREDSDNDTAQAMNGLLQYMWQISEGDMVLRRVIDDYCTVGMGASLCYQDGMADMGKGEVKIMALDPLDVYIDPNSRHPFCDDAERIMIVRKYTKEQAKKMLPMYHNAISKASGADGGERPETGNSNNVAFFPDNIDVSADKDEEIVGYHDYKKVIRKRFRVYQTYNGGEHLFREEEFLNYIKEPVWVINGNYIDDPQKAQMLIQQLQQQMQQQQMQQQQQQQMAMEAGQPAQPQQPMPEIELEETTKGALVDRDVIDVVEIPIWRIQEAVVMGDKLLYKRILEIEKYPVVVFMNIHTGTPFPLSDVRMVKDKQRFVNKMRSLIIAHASTATNIKLLVPQGSQDLDELEKKWAKPGAIIPYDPDEGEPHLAQPAPIPNELFKAEQDSKNDIDHEFGIYALSMGDSQSAPSTYKATISVDEFGQRRVKSKLLDIEAGLKRLASIAIPLMQQLYTIEKIVRIVQPNGTVSEYMINKRMYDEYDNETLKTINNVTTGMYDVIVVAGSTLPSNRYAQLEMYMDAYKNGIIDRQEVLKKTEIFDSEGVLMRTDEIGKLEQQVQAQDEQIKKLTGDLQTREREVYHIGQRLEIEKFKTRLNGISTEAKGATKLYEERLGDATKEMNKITSETAKIEKQKREQNKNSQVNNSL